MASGLQFLPFMKNLLVSSLSLLSVAFVPQAMAVQGSPPSASAYPYRPCETPECISAKTEMIRLGYASDVAERVAVYRPDVARLILNTETKIQEPTFSEIGNDNHISQSTQGWTREQSQSRAPQTV